MQGQAKESQPRNRGNHCDDWKERVKTRAQNGRINKQLKNPQNGRGRETLARRDERERGKGETREIKK